VVSYIFRSNLFIVAAGLASSTRDGHYCESDPTRVWIEGIDDVADRGYCVAMGLFSYILTCL
jgi:hypothetical protein